MSSSSLIAIRSMGSTDTIVLETISHHPAMTAPWIKAYLNSTKFGSATEGFIRELFTTKIEEAMHYESREEAQIDVRLICGKRIEIDTSDGHLHILENFQVEERAPKEFVISRSIRRARIVESDE